MSKTIHESPTIIRANGEHEPFDCPPVYDGQREVRDALSKVVGGYIEHVHVLYNEKHTYMMVNETGAVQDPPLPINREATAIYHTWAAGKAGVSVEEYYHDNPKIHGDVVLLVGVKVR